MNKYSYKLSFLIMLLFCIFFYNACSKKSETYSVNESLTEKEKAANLWSIIRYIGRMPELASDQTKFNPEFDSAYMEQMSLFTVEAWHKKGKADYFLISRRAPSLTDKFVATGGRIVYDNKGGIEEYEEVFRTWKMIPDTLRKRSMILFDKMVKEESLKQFETKYSNGVEYIEFPDERTYYDKQERVWKIKS